MADAEFERELRRVGRRRIQLAELRRLWLIAHPEQSQNVDRDSLLLAELNRMSLAGALALPAPASYQHAGSPPMPLFVTLASIKRETSAPVNWAEIPWLPVMGFWPELKPSELEVARQLNEWMLRRRGNFAVVPLRERAIEIFGDEKFLDLRVRAGMLFNGRLPIAEIGAMQVAHPLPYRAVDVSGRPMLVVENHHTYWSFCEWNRRARRYKAIVYGNGRAFVVTGGALAEAMRECAATEVEYFGDIDPAGIQIPVGFNVAGDGTVRPAVALYRKLLDLGRAGPLGVPVPKDLSFVQAWLPELHVEIIDAWRAGLRYAQEALGTEQLQQGI